MDGFFQELQAELQPGIKKILTHPFFQRLAEASLSRLQLREFAQQYHIYCSYFPRYLAAVAANVPDDATRLSLVENLWEEHGEGNLEHSHRTLFCRFLTGVDVPEAEWQSARPLPSTAKYVEVLFDLCQHAHFLEGLGALGPGTEFFTSEEYKLILSSLKGYEFLSDYDLEFWSVHIDMDEGHYAGMVSSLVPWATSEENRRLIAEGAHRAVDLEILFWDGLCEALLS
jgi:pyrroloquinoline-quinone synthase